MTYLVIQTDIGRFNFDFVPNLKLELPVAATNIAGNGEEGKKIITNTEQIRSHHDCQTKVDLTDAKYDTIENYTSLRGKGSIPIIDYNPRREKLTAKDLRLSSNAEPHRKGPTAPS